MSRPATAKQITSNRIPPISNVTKQSFKKCSMDGSGLHSPQGGTAHFPHHKPLLPKRQMKSEERDTHPPGKLQKPERVLCKKNTKASKISHFH